MQAVDAYFEMWNETDAAKRAGHIDRAWEAEGHYVDPVLEAKGAVELSGMVDAVHGMYPGHRFRPTSGVDAHHGLIRFGWELVAPDGSVTAEGLDVGVVSEAGKLQRIAGFIGPLPEAAA
jgi:hypothetical protein